MHARQATRGRFGGFGTAYGTGKRPPARLRPLPPDVAVPAAGGRPPARDSMHAVSRKTRAPLPRTATRRALPLYGVE